MRNNLIGRRNDIMESILKAKQNFTVKNYKVKQIGSYLQWPANHGISNGRQYGTEDIPVLNIAKCSQRSVSGYENLLLSGLAIYFMI